MRKIVSGCGVLTALIVGANIETNVWQGIGDGSAAAHWSLGVPTVEQVICIPASSDVVGDLSWGSAMPFTVAGWVQEAGYTNAVTFATTKGTAYAGLVITGHAELWGGRWRHTRDTTSSTGSKIGLFVSVGGDLTTGAEFTFDALGWGYRSQKGPSGTAGQYTGVGHGGEGGGRDGLGLCYDSYSYPNDLGSSASFNSGQSGNMGGGGLVNVRVAGTFVHDGVITVDGSYSSSYCSHAGGSIYVQAHRLLGSGMLTANAGKQTANFSSGGGGRIAIVSATQTFDALTNEFTGAVTAHSWASSSSAATPARAVFGGNGTIYYQTPKADGETGGASSLSV